MRVSQSVGLDDEVVEQLRETLHSMRTGFFRVEVFEGSGYMLCEREGVEALGYRCLNNLLKRVLRMSTELARVAVMRVWHSPIMTTGSISRGVYLYGAAL